MTEGAAMSAKVVLSASLSSTYDRRYIVLDEATGEVLDDAQGYGCKTAQNAHRAQADKSMSPKKNRQRDAGIGGSRCATCRPS
jgi:hypothetical protein